MNLSFERKLIIDPKKRPKYIIKIVLTLTDSSLGSILLESESSPRLMSAKIANGYQDTTCLG
jgi:hypothetical protein